MIAAIACGPGALAQAPLDDITRAALSGRPILVIVHESPSFEKRTPGKTLLSFAGFYAGGAIGAGAILISTYDDNGTRVVYRIEDPGVEIARQLAVRIAHHLAASSCEFIEVPLKRKINSAREYKTLVPDDTLVLEVRTTHWGIIHRPFKMARYFVSYGARARLIDPALNRIAAGSDNSQLLQSANRDAEFEFDELLADDAKLLKSELAANVPIWVDRLFAELTSAGEVGTTECRSLATPLAIETN